MPIDIGGYQITSGMEGYLISIVTDSLTLHLDARNTSSYPGSGTTWYDLSGNGGNMTLYNGTAYNSNGYFDFDGTNDYAKTSNNGLGTGSVIPHTLEMWVNFDVLSSTRWWLAVIGQYNIGAHHWIGTTATQFGAWSANCQRGPTLTGANNWMQIVGTFDGTTLTYYVNSINTGGSCTANGFNFTNTDFTIGLRLGNEAYFNGKVAVCRIYNRALSSTEITQNYDATKGRFGL
jgi:hypothetical protein